MVEYWNTEQIFFGGTRSAWPSRADIPQYSNIPIFHHSSLKVQICRYMLNYS